MVAEKVALSADWLGICSVARKVDLLDVWMAETMDMEEVVMWDKKSAIISSALKAYLSVVWKVFSMDDQ